MDHLCHPVCRSARLGIDARHPSASEQRNLGSTVIAFLDTEFTDLVVRPRLLSVGLVAGASAGREFYAEVTDSDRIRAASWYAQDAVLPQFGKVAHAACTYAALGLRLASFLAELTGALEDGEGVEIAFGYHLDWELIERAIQDAGASHWEATRRRLLPVNVYEITGFDAGALAAEAYFKSQASASFSRHHALCDARALRLAYAATLRGSAATPGATAPAASGSS